MELKSGLSAFVTGGASGIALAQKGIFVTVVDFSQDRGKEVASLVHEENLKFHSGLKFPSAIFLKRDVTNK
ncbi:ARP protein, partial [Tanacetum coccineum]